MAVNKLLKVQVSFHIHFILMNDFQFKGLTEHYIHKGVF